MQQVRQLAFVKKANIKTGHIEPIGICGNGVESVGLGASNFFASPRHPRRVVEVICSEIFSQRLNFKLPGTLHPTHKRDEAFSHASEQLINQVELRVTHIVEVLPQERL